MTSRAIFWLAGRFATAGRMGQLAGTLLLGFTTFVLVFLALATASASQVYAHQQARRYSVSPRVNYSKPPTSGDLLTFAPPATPPTVWNGHRIVRRYYAMTGSTARIPGVSQPLLPGEYAASPDLVRLIQADDVVRALFSRLTRTGIIGPAGLVQPHELMAVIGIPRDGPLRVAVQGFGSDQQLGFDDPRPVLNASVGAMVLVLLWAPTVAFAVMVARLGARRTASRYRSLRALGLSRPRAHAVTVAQTSMVTVPTSILAAAAFSVVVRHVTRVPGTSVGYFSGDAAVPWLLQLAVCFGAVVLMAALAVGVHREPSRPSKPMLHPCAGAVGVITLAISAAYLVLLPVVRAVVGPAAGFGLWMACAGAAIGLALAGPRIVGACCRTLASRVRRAGTLVGVRLGDITTTTTTRFGSLACVVIVIMLGAASFMAMLNGGSQESWERALKAHPIVPVIVDDNGRLTRADVRAAHPRGGIAQLQEVGPGRSSIKVVYATCDDLQQLSGAVPIRCPAGPAWVNRADRDAAGHTIRLSGRRLLLPASTTTVSAPRLPRSMNGALRLDPKRSPGVPTTNGSRFFLLVPSGKLSTTMAAISSAVPAVQFNLGRIEDLNPDSDQFAAQSNWLTFGAVASLIVCALGLLATATGEARERSARLRGLRVLGASTAELARAHAWATAAPIAILGLAGTALGAIICMAIRVFDDRAIIPFAPIIGCAIGCLAASVVIASLTLRDALRTAPKPGSIDA